MGPQRLVHGETSSHIGGSAGGELASTARLENVKNLEAQSRLEFNDSSRQTIGSFSELPCVVAGWAVVDDIGLRGCWYQRSKVDVYKRQGYGGEPILA